MCVRYRVCSGDPSLHPHLSLLLVWSYSANECCIPEVILCLRLEISKLPRLRTAKSRNNLHSWIRASNLMLHRGGKYVPVYRERMTAYMCYDVLLYILCSFQNRTFACPVEWTSFWSTFGKDIEIKNISSLFWLHNFYVVSCVLNIEFLMSLICISKYLLLIVIFSYFDCY